MTRLVVSFALLFMIANTCVAETLYVTDLLRLNVSEKPQPGGKTVTTLNSGDPLTVLERQAGYVKVQTRDGLTGWAKSAYLVADKPARLIVAETQEKLTQTQEQLSQAREDAKSAQGEAVKYRKAMQTAEETLQQQNSQLENIEQQNRKYAFSTMKYASSVPINIFLIAGILLFLLGILLGWYIMDYRLRKRHGGFRI